MSGGRPIKRCRERRRGKLIEIFIGIHNLAANNRKHRLKVFNFFFRHSEIVRGQYSEICQLTSKQTTFSAILGRKPTAAFGVKHQRFFPAQTSDSRLFL